MTSYKDMNVWKSSMVLVQKTYAISRILPGDEKFGLCSQMTRAAVSIPSNIAEGLGRKGKNETIHFLHIARGSLYELETLVEVLRVVYSIKPADYDEIMEILVEVRQYLNGFIRYLNGKDTR